MTFGIAGAGVIAASLAAIGHAFPGGPARTRATGIWGAAVGGGIALGPVAGVVEISTTIALTPEGSVHCAVR